MKIRTLALALGFTTAATVLLPAVAEARDHRHGRHCRHSRTYERSYDRYDYGYRGSRYNYDRYNYDYGYRDYGYYAPPPPRYGYRYGRVWHPRSRVSFHYHGPRRCNRSHLSIRFGF